MRGSASRRHVRSGPAGRQGGFTLLEVLIVIIIISLLIALLVPAVVGARQSVRNAQVRTEITNLDSAISDFKLTYGINPPSRIVLYERATGDGTMAIQGWNTPITDPDTMTYTVEDVAEQDRLHSRSFIRQLWPQFDFNFIDTTMLPGPSQFGRDLNNDGDHEDTFLLLGSDCLAFFLGGMVVTAADTQDQAQIGFSKNPANPFKIGTHNAAGANATRIDAAEIDRSNREGPFFPFVLSRLNDTNNNLVLEYFDTIPGQTAPYIYLSSYDGQGYRHHGLDGLPGFPGDDDGDTFAEIEPGPDGQPGAAMVDDNGDTVVDDAAEFGWPGTDDLPDPDEVGLPGSDDEVAAGTLLHNYLQSGLLLTGQPWNGKSFQIISPGADNEYGIGGRFDTDSAQTDFASNRTPERDNITNFNGGVLAP